MSPELLYPGLFGFNDSRPTKGSDCYALGMVILEVLSGKTPFSGDKDYIVMRKVIDGERPGRPEVVWFTDDLWRTLERCWLPQPGDRPTAELVLECLGPLSATWQPPPPSPVRDEEHDDEEDNEPHQYHQPEAVTPTRGLAGGHVAGARNDSPARRLEGDMYRLRVKAGPGSAVGTHKAWKVEREGGDFDYEGDTRATATNSGTPEIPDTTARQSSPPLPPLLQSEAGGEMVHVPEPHWTHQWHGSDVQQQTPPWQLINQRLLNWAVNWRMSELDAALESTTKGRQVDEISVTIWATQTYKRYVRHRMTDPQQGRMDRLFVPPNVADAISMAVFNGRHGDACTMLKDLWAPFGLDGVPRLLIVLAKHRADSNHWVAHRCVHGSPVGFES